MRLFIRSTFCQNIRHWLVSQRSGNRGLIFFMCLLPIAVEAQNFDADIENGLEFTAIDTMFSFRINPVLQNQIVVNNNEEASPEVYFRNRRTRFYLSGFIYDTRLTYKIQLRFESNNQNLYDAAFKFKLNKAFTFWVGRETLPAARSQLVSLKYLQFVDRSIVHSVFDLQKDLGIWAFYNTAFGAKHLKISTAFSNGEGIFRSADTRGYSYTGRVDLFLLGKFANGGDVKGSDLQREPTPKLALGVAYNFNDEATANRGQRGTVFPNTTTTDIHTVYVDGMLNTKGFL